VRLIYFVTKPKGASGIVGGHSGKWFRSADGDSEGGSLSCVVCVEDLEYHLKLVQAGYRVEFVNEIAGDHTTVGRG
jgi:hypothetical protein